MRKIFLPVLLLSALAMGSPVHAKKPPPMTPMELQALQSREFKSPKDQVFSSVMSVFQDMGYQVSSADMASGFITGVSANTNKTGFFEALAGMRSSGGSRVTAFVEQMPSGYTRARINFMNTKNTSGNWGSSSSKDTPVLDAKTYQIAFERVEQALFERGALTKAAPVAVASPVATTVVAAPTATESNTPSPDKPKP